MLQKFVPALALALVLPSAAVAGELEANLGGLTPTNVKGYLGPLNTALSATLNAAVFQGASIPTTGFHLNVGVRSMGISFDDEDRTYGPTDPPGFTSTESVDAPTVIGDVNSVPQNGQGGLVLNHPGGLDVGEFGIAVPQLTIGNVAGTRAVLRFISLELSDSDFGDLSLFGIGAQHSISRYFQNLPVDLALGAFYQNFQVGEDLIDSNALQIMLTGSRRYGMLEPYVGVGYDHFSMDVSYTDTTSPTPEDVTVEFDSESGGHLTLGVQGIFKFLRLHAEYNLAAQSSVAVGMSFGN
jgi:hypothetical protein